MTVFLDDSCAPLLPGRHRFAIFRLVSYLRLRTAVRGHDPRRLYFVDRDQSSLEQYATAVWATGTAAAFFGGWLAAVWPDWLAAVAALPLAAMAIQLPIVLLGATLLPLWERITGRPLQRIRFQSRLLMSLLILGALLAATSGGWLRYVGWHVLALGCSNGLAAVIMLVIRRDVARLERDCGVS